MAEYRLSYEGQDVDDILANAVELTGSAVRVTSQSFTAAQKAQARKNIGAGENIDVTALFTVGGTLSVSGDELKRSHLYYNDSNSFFSTVTLSVVNRVWYFEARRVTLADNNISERKYIAVCNADNGVFTSTQIINK
jgi:hypothetical protein